MNTQITMWASKIPNCASNWNVSQPLHEMSGWILRAGEGFHLGGEAFDRPELLRSEERILLKANDGCIDEPYDKPDGLR